MSATIRIPSIRQPGRRLGQLVVSASLALAGLAGTTSIAAADEPMYGYTVNITASVGCDAGAGTMTVTPYGTTFQAQGFLGPTLGAYDAGQWVRYSVYARELGAGQWTDVYTWSAWEWLVSISNPNSSIVISSPHALGTSTVTGTAGHNYEVLVQVDYWTGKDNIYNITPSYSQDLSLGGLTFGLAPGYCHL